jgi:hypothetical protein
MSVSIYQCCASDVLPLGIVIYAGAFLEFLTAHTKSRPAVCSACLLMSTQSVGMRCSVPHPDRKSRLIPGGGAGIRTASGYQRQRATGSDRHAIAHLPRKWRWHRSLFTLASRQPMLNTNTPLIRSTLLTCEILPLQPVTMSAMLTRLTTRANDAASWPREAGQLRGPKINLPILIRRPQHSDWQVYGDVGRAVGMFLHSHPTPKNLSR